MFFLKKLVTCIVLPPGVFILVFIGSGLYLFKRRRRTKIGSQRSEIGSQRSEIGSQRSDVRRARARDGGGEGKGKRLLMEMGVAEQDIIEEHRSKDTSENARYAKQIIEKKGFKSPILVTSAYHMKRAVFLFEKQGMKVEPFPCGLKSEEEEEEYGILDFLPKASVLEESSKALKEYLGLMAARIGIH